MRLDKKSKGIWMKKGIDVSRHQGLVDWAKVKAAGIDFAILRAGYGMNTKDDCFDRNAKGCVANNIQFGAYWFMYCKNAAEAEKNADKCHESIKKFKDNITMLVWCDFEYDTEKKANNKGVTFTKATRTACVNAFCKRLESYGYKVGYYANPDYLKTKFNKISYPLWLAAYTGQAKYGQMIWQYSESGKVYGISGNVDMNYSYMDDAKTLPTVPEPTLKRGSKGDAVWNLQECLKYLGYDISVDKSFGPATESVVKKWQKDNKLTQDGSYGPASHIKMKSLIK